MYYPSHGTIFRRNNLTQCFLEPDRVRYPGSVFLRSPRVISLDSHSQLDPGKTKRFPRFWFLHNPF